MNALKTFFVDDWYFAIPMTLMALAAFALVAWRFLLNVYAKTDLDALMPDLQDNLKHKGVRGAIALLKEYRTALISAAVTGKIDVRGAA